MWVAAYERSGSGGDGLQTTQDTGHWKIEDAADDRLEYGPRTAAS